MKVLILVSGLVVMASVGCNLTGANKIKGSGVVKSEKRSLAPFTALDVNCAGSVDVRMQEPESLEISGDDNLIPLIITEVKDDTLYIRSIKKYAPREKLRIMISIPDLGKFVFAGAGDASISNIKNNRFEIVLSGAGDVKASGETKEAAITLSGAGDLDARNLLAKSAKANSTGVGSVDVYASEQLEAKSSGVGEINYFGSPKIVKKESSGIGSINER